MHRALHLHANLPIFGVTDVFPDGSKCSCAIDDPPRDAHGQRLSSLSSTSDLLTTGGTIMQEYESEILSQIDHADTRTRELHKRVKALLSEITTKDNGSKEPSKLES